MYTCIIIDDQPEAMSLIKDHLLKTPQLSILLMTTDPVEGLSFLDKHKPDIIFLDIEMPEITGVEFVENIKAKWGNKSPKVVFTTGYCDFAITGFEHGVVDYLLKPISFVRFKKCIDRIIEDLDKRAHHPEKPDLFFAEEDGKKVKINFSDIIFIKATGNYIFIHTFEAKKIVY
jgi:two-component system LytT family response regulator